ncbi:hypothetical protein E2553_35075 [Paraburkholderia dipogonis]|uniref:Uncharacterized protein n=1 Tax=Paraburkholderia dipogonis TaxID=1211383 RepID=A0A4Y8MWW0_9BURK|nr:hypothetical protein [Paraburkholderia dipogonis]TFE41865.1 hypothetical protein E2553_35075 [Paraburkholderia dipogonis]
MNTSKRISPEQNSAMAEMSRIRSRASYVDDAARMSVAHSDEAASWPSTLERFWSLQIESLVSIASMREEIVKYQQSGAPTILEVDRGTEFRSTTLRKIIEGLGLELCLRSPRRDIRGNETNQSDPKSGELLPEVGAK